MALPWNGARSRKYKNSISDITIKLPCDLSTYVNKGNVDYRRSNEVA